MIEKRKKRKKIFYVPGMISLVLIPLFCLYHFYKVDAFKINYAIKLDMPNPEDFVKYNIVSLRNYKVYKFNGVESEDRLKLNEMSSYLKKLIKEKDTVNGIKIQYNVKTNYDTFIRTLDILAIENPPTWGMFSNDVYVIPVSNSLRKSKNEKAKHIMHCGTMEIMRQQSYLAEKKRKEEEDRVFQVYFFRQNFIKLFLGYVGIVILNIFVLVKFNKNKNYNQK